MRIRTFLILTVVVAFWLWLGRILSAAFDAPGKRWEALLMAVVLPGGLIVVFAEPWFAPMFQAHRTAPLPPERDNLGLHLRGPWGELRRPRKPAAADGETDRTPPP